MKALIALASLSAVLLSGQQKKAAEKPGTITGDGAISITTIPLMKMPEPEVEMDEPVRRDGRIIYTLSLKADWSCSPISNWMPHGYDEGTVTAVQLVCVKTAAPPDTKKDR